MGDAKRLQVLACKVISIGGDGKASDTIKNEYEALKELAHPNIVPVVDFLCTPDLVLLYMEFCDGGSLENFIKQMEKYLPYCHNLIHNPRAETW